MIAQLTWDAWKELINFSTPLAGLIAVGYILVRGCKWLGIEVIQPVFGPEGMLIKHLSSQREEAVRHTKSLESLGQTVASTGVVTAGKLNELVTLASADKTQQASLHEEVEDLLMIHSHWAGAARLSSDNPAVHEHLAAIRKITDKYAE